MPQVTVRPLETEADANQLRELAAQAFNFPAENWETFLAAVGPENVRLARVDASVIGGLSHYPVGQWFGGEVLPMAALALVTIAPEHRGRGWARAMLDQELHALKTAGFPLATLYPSTQTFYRKLGFEQAGNAYDYAMALQDIGNCEPKLPLRRVDPEAAQPCFETLATTAAKSGNGQLERNAGLWKRLFFPRNGTVYAYLVGSTGNEQGYLIYDQIRYANRTSSTEQAWEQRALNIRDMTALSGDAMESIWHFVHTHRTVTEICQWTGPATDPRNWLTAEYETKVVRGRRWMLRLLDVAAALRGRGYPPVSDALLLDVTDELFPENNQRFELSVRDGVAEVSVRDTPAPGMAIHVRDLAPLFTGLLSAKQLAALNRVTAPPQVLASADRLFLGSEPWMSDSF